MRIPNNYLPVMPYLILSDAQAFSNFMKHVFHAEEQLIVPGERGIMHGELRIGDAVIMFANATELWQPFPGSVFIYVEEVEGIFERAFSEGCKQLQELAQREYGYGGGFEDPFGNQWWVNAYTGEGER
ncbi:MAG: VOC family protein [Chitinophagaceae bacterium]